MRSFSSTEVECVVFVSVLRSELSECMLLLHPLFCNALCYLTLPRPLIRRQQLHHRTKRTTEGKERHYVPPSPNYLLKRERNPFFLLMLPAALELSEGGGAPTPFPFPYGRGTSPYRCCCSRDGSG